jgi:hypothetical protein
MGHSLSCPGWEIGIKNKCIGTVICPLLNPHCGERKSRRAETMKWIGARADSRENT